MAETLPGKLVWRGQGKDRKRLVMWQTRKGGMTPPSTFNERELAAELRAQQEDIDVELELEKGRPCRIRPVGQVWTASAVSPPPVREPPRPRGERFETRPAAPQPAQSHPVVSPAVVTDFHNPYNFIPVLPRTRAHSTALGDHAPVGHDCYAAECYSGRLRVTLTVETPLVLPDTSRASVDANAHKSLPVRVDRDGKPSIPPTSLKGMLRAAYEAITNSRLVVFVGHDDRLAYRMPARLGPVPARVQRHTDGTLGFRVMKADVLGYAAKLPRYKLGRGLGPDKGEREAALPYPSGQLPQHGDPVWVEVIQGTVRFIEVRDPKATTPPGSTRTLQRGWVCITGPNIRGKRHERVFLEGAQDVTIPVEEAHYRLWKELIVNYQDTHVTDLAKRKRQGQRPQDYLGDDPGRTGWSRHIYTSQAEELGEGTLCYMVCNRPDDVRSGIRAVLPVTISRRLFAISPEQLLDPSLHPAANPAEDLAQLSPADRVFGWVNQQGKGAYRGQMRLSSVTCTTDDALVDFGTPGVPLAILGQPKPQQARFYVAADDAGHAQADRLAPEDAGYQFGKSLRGRKVYPHHHHLPEHYWANPLEDRTQRPDTAPFFQEYRRPRQDSNEQRDDQNRSIQGWVRPGATFRFDIHVINLSAVELGALVWLLQLPPQSYHRLGSGKPLGFGSVRLDLDAAESDIRQGTAWQEHYRSLDCAASPCDLDVCVTAYKDAVQQVYGTPFEQVPFMAAFCRAAQGFDDHRPTHYPRIRAAGTPGHPRPHPEGESFKWFVENARQNGPQYALRDLATDPGLPILEDRDRPSSSRPGGPPGRRDSGAWRGGRRG